VVRTPANARTTYTWNNENRNTKLQLASGAPVTMTYRDDGLRYQKQSAATTIKFLYDEQNYLAESDAAGTVNKVLTNEPMAYGNLVSQRILLGGSTWTPIYHHFDALGSARQITSAAAVVANTYAYTAWGEKVNPLTSETINNFFCWVGMLGYYFDEEYESYYVRARHYRPTIGRWISLDPLLYPIVNQYNHARTNLMSASEFDELNYFEYTQSQPVMRVDTTGNAIAQGSTGLPADWHMRKDANGVCECRTNQPDPTYVPKPNGCTIVGSPFGGYSFTSACNNHDICYSTCNVAKNVCDDRFLQEMMRICSAGRRRVGFFNWLSCQVAAREYFAAVQLVGERFYQAAQDAACRWKPCQGLSMGVNRNGDIYWK
jgi:RHS repeat-associated protein